MKKIVINKCFGGFGLSDLALDKLGINDYYDIPRDDPKLVAVVEELGQEANGQYANLKIVEIPDDAEWQIEAYDGQEHVAEKHQTWG
jgi:hypothetical protein